MPARRLAPEFTVGKLKQHHSTNIPTVTWRKEAWERSAKWHGQQNNVALSGERTHNSWSEMIFQCTTLPCMAWRGTVGILNLAKYQNAFNAWRLARSSLCKPHAKLIIFYSQTYCTVLLHSISTKMGIISRIYLKMTNNNMKPDTWLRVCCWSSLYFTST